MPFVELATKLLKASGIYGNIIPNTFLSADFGKQLREFLLHNVTLHAIVDVSLFKAFGNVGTYPILLFYSRKTCGKSSEIRIAQPKDSDELQRLEFNSINQHQIVLNNQNYVISTSYNKASFDFIHVKVNHVVYLIKKKK